MVIYYSWHCYNLDKVHLLFQVGVWFWMLMRCQWKSLHIILSNVIYFLLISIVLPPITFLSIAVQFFCFWFQAGYKQVCICKVLLYSCLENIIQPTFHLNCCICLVCQDISQWFIFTYIDLICRFSLSTWLYQFSNHHHVITSCKVKFYWDS